MVRVTYKDVIQPVVKIEIQDPELGRILVAQQSKTVGDAVTIYIRSISNEPFPNSARVRIPKEEVKEFCKSLIALSKQ